MGALNNSYLTFKKLGGLRLPEFLKKKQYDLDKIDRKFKYVNHKLDEENEEVKAIVRQVKVQKLMEEKKQALLQVRDSARHSFKTNNPTPTNLMINDTSEVDFNQDQIGAFSRAQSKPTLEKNILPNLDHQYMISTKDRSVFVQHINESESERLSDDSSSN